MRLVLVILLSFITFSTLAATVVRTGPQGRETVTTVQPNDRTRDTFVIENNAGVQGATVNTIRNPNVTSNVDDQLSNQGY